MSDYLKNKKIFDGKRASCFVYWLKPGGIEKKHYHCGVEFVYVMKGSCQTHQQGKFYFYKKGQTHEVINDSIFPLQFICLTIPQESEKNTVYL